MTYRELLEKLKGLNDQQLDQEVRTCVEVGSEVEGFLFSKIKSFYPEDQSYYLDPWEGGLLSEKELSSYGDEDRKVVEEGLIIKKGQMILTDDTVL